MKYILLWLADWVLFLLQSVILLVFILTDVIGKVLRLAVSWILTDRLFLWEKIVGSFVYKYRAPLFDIKNK